MLVDDARALPINEVKSQSSRAHASESINQSFTESTSCKSLPYVMQFIAYRRTHFGWNSKENTNIHRHSRFTNAHVASGILPTASFLVQSVFYRPCLPLGRVIHCERLQVLSASYAKKPVQARLLLRSRH